MMNYNIILINLQKQYSLHHPDTRTGQHTVHDMKEMQININNINPNKFRT